MSPLLWLAAVPNPDVGFDVFTILGVIGIILGIIVLALRVASHSQMDYTRHGDVGFRVSEPGGDRDPDDMAEMTEPCSQSGAGK